jgi:hypothetical protein
MSNFLSPSCPILQLPVELILEILQLSRPNGFQAFMRTCKTIYQVGAGLIEEHNFCKSWKIFQYSWQIEDYLVFEGLFIFFQSFLELQPSKQDQVLSYLNNIDWIGGFHPIPKGITGTAILVRIASEIPWLFQEIQRISRDLQDLRVNNKEFMFSCEFQMEDFGVEHERLGIAKLGSNLVIPDLIGLLLLPNLLSLIVSDRGGLEILALVAHYNGETYFQQLQTIHLKGRHRKSLSQITPLLLLPKLKSLIIYTLDDCNTLMSSNESTSFYQLDSARKSSLANICFYDADADYRSIASFLASFLVVRSFVWENSGNLEDEDPKRYESSIEEGVQAEHGIDETVSLLEAESNDGGSIKDGGPEEGLPSLTSELHWLPIIKYDSEGEAAIDHGSKSSSSSGWDVKPGQGLSFWNPSKLLGEVLYPHRDTLEHLAVTIALDTAHFTYIEKPHLIQHFKDFNNLKYLEFDTRVMKTRKGKHHQIPPEGIPCSLASILPSSVEVVRILVYEPEFLIVHAMLRSLPQQMSSFPYLRTLCLVLNADDWMAAEFADTDLTIETKTRMIPLQQDLEGVGVQLSFEIGRFSGFDPRANIVNF